jgi:hypothetical protein
MKHDVETCPTLMMMMKKKNNYIAMMPKRGANRRQLAAQRFV